MAFTAATDWTPLATATTPSAIDAAAAALLETETFTQTRTYDALNRVTSQTEPDLTEIKPTYNQRGLLEKVEARIRNAASWTPFVSSIEYDAKAQRQSIEYGNGTATTYQYDELTYRLKLLTTTRTSPSNTLQHLSYTFDAAGNIVQITDQAQQTLFYNNGVVLPQNLFEYDALYRLTSATGREHASIGDVQVDHNDVPLQNLPHANDPNAVRTYLEEYQYDHVGNILEMFHEAAGTPVATWTRTYSYASGNNRLASNTIPGGTATYTHDAHGNITAMPHLGAITYSPWDQMQSADLGGGGDVYYTYGRDGQRVRKVWQQTASAVKERIYLGGYEIYREKISGVTQLERQTLHLMDGVQRIAMVETKTIEGGVPITTPVPKQRYQLGNHLGSAMLEVDETGLIISYEEYHPYGTSAYRSARSGVEVSARRYRYTGKERDDETGLYYYGARYYAAWLGRWTSADPLGIGADGPGLYNYTRGSPVTLTDPNGLEVPSPEREKELGIAPLPPEQPRDDRFTAEGVGKGALNSLLDRFADVSKGLMIAVAPLGAHRVTSDAPQTPMMQAVQQVDKAIEEGNYKDVSPSEEFAGAIAVFAAELALGAALGKLAVPRALVGPAATHASPPSSPSGPSGPVGRALDWLGERAFPNAGKEAVTPEGVRWNVSGAGPGAEGRSLSTGGTGGGSARAVKVGKEQADAILKTAARPGGTKTTQSQALRKLQRRQGDPESTGLFDDLPLTEEAAQETVRRIVENATTSQFGRLKISGFEGQKGFALFDDTGRGVLVRVSDNTFITFLEGSRDLGGVFH